ncbi:MAG: class I SAM-dependent methyltransferase [Candidatus Omnitrophota bacterium]|jgi:ubiquinone/menaquinone biosynthesis C-methylase UbiE|nr:class I SAM-dependent methyltransferase [Candidatus Omnitrophota bacterium]
MSDVFDKYYNKYEDWYDKHKFAFLSELEAIKKVFPSEAKGLEIGVGTGRFAAALGITIGIDVSGRMLDIAQERGVNVRMAFGEDIPFLNETFDFVAIIITLCFVENPKKVLAEAYRVLTRAGKIIIGIVDKESFLGKYYRRKKSVFYKQAKFFSVKEVTDLLKETGFASFSYYQTIFVLPDEMSSVERPKRGFGKGGFVVISGKKMEKEIRLKPKRTWHICHTQPSPAEPHRVFNS